MANIEQKLDELAQVVSSNQTITKFGLAATSLLAYDLFITFHREVTCIWKRQWSAVTFVYAAIRYCTLLNMTLQCVLGFMASPPNITVLVALTYVMDIMSITMIAVFSCLWVWAICGKRWLPFIAVFALSMFGPVINIYNFSNPAKFSIEHTGPNKGCNEVNTQHRWRYFPILTRSIAFASDLLVVLLTWWKTASIVKEGQRAHINTSLSTILLKNGALQFIGLSILNAITIILDVLEIATSVTEPGSEFIYINEAVSAILICRFLIDLRNIYVSETTMDIDTASHGQATTIRFAHSFVGNAGAPLDTFSDDSEDGSSIDSGAIRYANDPFEYGLLRRDTTNLAISDAQAS